MSQTGILLAILLIIFVCICAICISCILRYEKFDPAALPTNFPPPFTATSASCIPVSANDVNYSNITTRLESLKNIYNWLGDAAKYKDLITPLNMTYYNNSVIPNYNMLTSKYNSLKTCPSFCGQSGTCYYDPPKRGCFCNSECANMFIDGAGFARCYCKTIYIGPQNLTPPKGYTKLPGVYGFIANDPGNYGGIQKGGAAFSGMAWYHPYLFEGYGTPTGLLKLSDKPQIENGVQKYNKILIGYSGSIPSPFKRYGDVQNIPNYYWSEAYLVDGTYNVGNTYTLKRSNTLGSVSLLVDDIGCSSGVFGGGCNYPFSPAPSWKFVSPWLNLISVG